MKQIPNIEEEKRDMELILEVLPHLILGNAEELYNNPDGEMAKNTISEMQRVIRETHHHQLQKARAEVYEKLTDQLYGMNLNISMAEQQNMFRELDYVYKKTNHSELDQDKQ